MKVALSRWKPWAGEYLAAWDGFWFAPRLPHTLCALRVIVGLMLLYSHLVLATDLSSFLGEHAWINNQTARELHDGAFGPADYHWSYLWHLSNPLLLWLHHLIVIVVTASLAAGFMTRVTAPLAFLLQLMYLHRLTGALFGFDQIATYGLMYVMLAPSGARFSVDAWLKRRFADRIDSDRRVRWLFPDAKPVVSATIATRLFQLHLCAIYLFGGLAKARGETWWDGTAVWYSVGNYEYQSMDMTWLAGFPFVFSALSHLTMFWEIFYCLLVWPRMTRPFVLAMAVAVHGGIAFCLGMITFGVMMIAANCVFLSPEWIARRIGDLDEQAEDEERPSGEPHPESSEPTSESSAVTTSTTDSTLAPEAERRLEEREERLKRVSKRLRRKSQSLKQRETKYRDRVKRLKEREAKIKRLVERRRKQKAAEQTERKPK